MGLMLAMLLLASCGGGQGDEQSDDAAPGSDATSEPDGSDEADGSEGSGETAAADDEIDPCTLLTDAEVEEVAEGPPDGDPDLDVETAIGMALCTWSVSVDDAVGQRFVHVAVHQTSRLTQSQRDAGMTARRIAEQNLAATDDAQEVDGLGHEAWFTPRFGTYVVLSDDLVLNVSASTLFGGADEPEERAATRTATELALANLTSQVG